jgi:hypothetical protein
MATLPVTENGKDSIEAKTCRLKPRHSVYVPYFTCAFALLTYNVIETICELFVAQGSEIVNWQLWILGLISVTVKVTSSISANPVELPSSGSTSSQLQVLLIVQLSVPEPLLEIDIVCGSGLGPLASA